jgi:hypothetical protein
MERRVDSCKLGNVFSSSINGKTFIYQLRYYQFLKKDYSMVLVVKGSGCYIP